MDKQREEFEAYLKQDGYDRHSFELSAFNKGCYHNDWIQFAWQAWQHAQKVAIPEGYVVVPKEPTEEMIVASFGHRHAGDDYCIADIYKAMIEAS